MTYTTYLLEFTAPLHLSNERPNHYEQSEHILRSDTIVAAIIATLAKNGTNQAQLENLQQALCISSAFPYRKVNGKVDYFFPKLMQPLPINPELKITDAKDRKGIKKVAWLKKGIFEAQLKGETTSIKDKKALGKLFKQSGDDLFFVKQTAQRVQIPRYGNDDPRPYYQEKLFFKEGCGLFFMVEKIEDEDSLKDLELALYLLQDEGFGTDRSVGNGQFNIFKGEINFKLETKSPYRTNLGLYCPKDHEQLQGFLPENDEHIAFQFMKRGGWIGTEGHLGEHKKQVYMFAEAGIFKTKVNKAGNAMIDLTPEGFKHNIWRSGQTIFLPINPYHARQ